MTLIRSPSLWGQSLTHALVLNRRQHSHQRHQQQQESSTCLRHGREAEHVALRLWRQLASAEQTFTFASAEQTFTFASAEQTFKFASAEQTFTFASAEQTFMFASVKQTFKFASAKQTFTILPSRARIKTRLIFAPVFHEHEVSDLRCVSRNAAQKLAQSDA
jgi:hypothetical protein